MFDLLRSRGLEVFLGVLLITGEANVISITLNKEAGFFTLNVGSAWFVWQQPLVASGPAAPMEEPTGKTPAASAGRAVSEGGDSSAPAAMGKQSNGRGDTGRCRH